MDVEPAMLDAEDALAPEALTFVAQHEDSELWMQQMLHGLSHAISRVSTDELDTAFRMLARVTRIMEQMFADAPDRSAVAPKGLRAPGPWLAGAAGMPGAQYRCIEFALGNKSPLLLESQPAEPETADMLEAAWCAPSLYDVAIRLLAARGLELPAACLNRDWSQPHQPHARVQAAWLEVHRRPGRYADLVRLADTLAAMEDSFRRWRLRHLHAVQRFSAVVRDAGARASLSCLSRMLDRVLFPELARLRT